MLSVRLLGQFDLRFENTPLAIPSRPAQSLFAYLVLTPGQAHRRERLAGLLWPDSPEANARANLRKALWQLRKALQSAGPGFLNSDDLAVSFAAQADYWLDVHLIERRLPPDAAIETLIETASAYQGELLPGFYDPWVLPERERLRGQFELKMQALLERLVEADRWPEVLEWGERWLALDQVCEPAYRGLMEAHAALGNAASVATTYQRCVEGVRGELGVEPSLATRSLYERLVHAGVSTPASSRPAPALRPGPAGPAALSFAAPALDRIVRGQLVARDHELAEARAVLLGAVTGEGQVLLVSGEPGIGKTRFVRELVSLARSIGAVPLTGECFTEGGAPYAPLTSILREALLERFDLASLHVPQLVLADLLTLAPVLRAHFPQVPANPRLDAPMERQRLLDSVLELMTLLTAHTPVMLVVDDAHWADRDTLTLLHHLARHARPLRLLMVLTYREAELAESASLNAMLVDLNRERLTRHVRLPRLNRDQTRALLVAMFAAEISPEFVDAIDRETDGNPFFIEEVCKALIDAGRIYYADGRWQRATMDEISVPPNIRSAIELRVGRLPEAAQAVLRLGAILGQGFDFATLKQAGIQDEDALLNALETAERAQLIRPAGHGVRVAFAFTHALISATLREGLSALRRQRLHRQAREALEQIRPDEFEALAWHAEQSGDLDQAAAYYARAGDRARSQLALWDAVHAYQNALAHWPASDPAGRADLHYKLGQCQWAITEPQSTLESFEAARALYETLGERLRTGDMERLIGRLVWEHGDREAAAVHYRRAFALLDEGPETVELARALSSMSQMYMVAAQFHQAIAWGERALALAEGLGAEDVIVHALNNLGSSRAHVHEFDQERGLSLLRESLKRALDAGLAYDACRAYFNLGEDLAGLGRYAEARSVFEAMYTYATRVHSHTFPGGALRRLAALDWTCGRWAAVLHQWPHILDWATGPWGVWVYRLLGRLNNDLGQPETARQELQRTLAQVESWGELQITVPHLEQLARAYALLGRESETAQTVQQFLEAIDRNPYVDWGCTMPVLFACHWYAGRPGMEAEAHACLGRLERADRQLRTPETQAARAEGWASVTAAQGHLLDAANASQSAATTWGTLGRPYDQARALSAVGRTLAETGDSSAAYAALEQALRILDSLAAQLDDPELKHGFLYSALVREVRQAIRPFTDPESIRLR